MKALQVGDPAPDVAVPDQDGAMVSLSDYRGRKPVVLFFYPKDDTPICTREACAFRDAYEDFLEMGAAVLGVSSDDGESHRLFATRHDLPFRLLSDTEGRLRAAFGVPKTMGLLPGRVTYVIDPQGAIRHVFNSQLAAARHVAEALETVKELSAEE